MELQWWIVYAGCVVVGALFGGGVGFGGAKLYADLDEIARLSPIRDRLTLAGVWVGAVLVAAAVGALYGYESASMGNSWIIGAIWGGAGGVLSPALFSPIRDAAVRAVGKAANALPNGNDTGEGRR